MSQTPITIIKRAMKPIADAVNVGICCFLTGYLFNGAPCGGSYCRQGPAYQLINWFQAVEIKIRPVTIALSTLTPRKSGNMSRIFW
jgi:hypothetical protein